MDVENKGITAYHTILIVFNDMNIRWTEKVGPWTTVLRMGCDRLPKILVLRRWLPAGGAIWGGSGSFWKGTHLDETEHREYILRALSLADCSLSVLLGCLWSEGLHYTMPFCHRVLLHHSSETTVSDHGPSDPQDKVNSSFVNFLRDFVIATRKSTFEKVSWVWHIYESSTIQKAE